MGEWSEYFEDFPEENPANIINGRFYPVAAAAAAARSDEAQRRIIKQQSSLLQLKMFRMAEDAKRAATKQEGGPINSVEKPPEI